jgi:hypothetical protein
MKRLIPFSWLCGLLAAGCIIVDVEDKKQQEEPAPSAAATSPAPSALIVENTETQPEEEMDRPLVRYYEIADT